MSKLRVVVAFIIAAGVILYPGSAAYAWPSVNCQPTAHYFYTCTIVSSAGTPVPSNIRWYQDGRHLSEWDNRTYAVGSCNDGQQVNVTVKATLVYPDGDVFKIEASDSTICQGNG